MALPFYRRPERQRRWTMRLFSWLLTTNATTHQDRVRRRGRRIIPSRQAAHCRLVLELLEARTLLSGVSFSPAVNYRVGDEPSSVAVGDFNGDGKPDLAVSNEIGSSFSVLLGNGDGTFQ